MTLTELDALLSDAGLYPILVESLDNHNSRSLAFVGSLEGFILAAKVLDSNALFISTTSVAEEHFYFAETSATDSIGETEEIDLCKIVPKLKFYKDKIGECGIFDLCTSSTKANLSFSITEDWMQSLAQLLAEARERVEEMSLLTQSELRAKEAARTKAVINKLRTLVKDQDFARLPTQLAMRAYAIDKIPELEEVHESELKREIQELRAKIQARNPRKT